MKYLNFKTVLGEIKTLPYSLCDKGINVTINKFTQILISPTDERIIFAPKLKKDAIYATKKSDFKKSN